jgi:hypothetical protein
MENLGKEFPDAATANLDDVKSYIMDRLKHLDQKVVEMAQQKLD